jgi:glycosyltransferase involved in cell wall biosynthesis
LHIAQIVLNLDIGGLEKMALDLATSEKRAGHKALIYSITHPGKLASVAESLGIPVTAFHKTHGLSPRVIFSIARQLRRDRIDVVHSHNAVIHHYAAAAGWLARVPVIVNTEHGLAGRNQPRLMQLFRAVNSITDAVVFVAAETERTFRRQALAAPRLARLIPNGIDAAPFCAASAHPGESRPRIRLGTIGRMVAVKDHATLLRAFQKLAAEHPAAELHILGYGELRDATLALARSLGISERVFVHGPETPVPQFLSSLDIFVISSLSEALPISLLEAMAAALPVVSTRVGGVPDVAIEGQAAWFCPPGDADALASVLHSACVASDLALRGAKAREIVLRDYSADVMARRYLDLFVEIAVNKRHPLERH